MFTLHFLLVLKKKLFFPLKSSYYKFAFNMSVFYIKSVFIL